MDDAYECICDPIVRLLRTIQAQTTYCADADCIQEGPDGSVVSSSHITTALAIAGWAVAVGVLYYTRPASMRAQSNPDEGLEKAYAVQNNSNDPNDRNQPPPPPPTA
eukprot:CFRG7892T1